METIKSTIQLVFLPVFFVASMGTDFNMRPLMRLENEQKSGALSVDFNISKAFKLKQGGFTLVEVMVTIVIFSFVMVMLFSSFNSFVSTGQSIAKGVESNERARDAFRRILEDLTCMYMPESSIASVQSSGDDQQGNLFQITCQETGIEGKTFSTLEFASLAGVQIGRSRPVGVVDVTYYVRKNSQGFFDLCRAERAIGSDREPDPCSDPVLAENITGFTIDLIDAQLNEYREWDADKESGGQSIPRVLNIGLTLKNESKEKIYETAVVLPVQEQILE